MNRRCTYCSDEGECILENMPCKMDDGDKHCTAGLVNIKAKPEAYGKYTVYFYGDNGEYIYNIICYCTTVKELLELIDDENNDYTYDIREIEI